MKSIIALAAATALIAGVSIAGAQTSSKSGSSMSKSSSSSSMNKKVTGSGKFCMEQSTGGSLNCKFASMEACQKEAKANNQCVPNPNSGTTGAK